MPHIEQWRPQIEEQASRVLGVPLRIGNISVRSGGWMPAVELRDVVLQDADQRPALALPRVVAALSARSLFALELRFEQLLIDGAHLEVRRDARGHVLVAGIDFSGPGSGRDNRAANWFFNQHEFVIRGGSLRWSDEQRGAPPLALADVQIVVRNGLRRHDMRIDATPPAEWGDRFSLRANFTQPLLGDSGDWRHWSGLAYAELPRADVSELRRHVTLPFELSEGDGALRAWLDVRDGQARGATVDLALREVVLRLSREVEPLALAQIEGRLAGQRDADGFTLAAQQFGFVTGDAIRWPRSDMKLTWRQREGHEPSGGEFSAQRLDLALMSQVASRVPLGEAVRKLLAELNPQGILSGFAAQWDGALDQPAQYQVKGVLSGLALAAKASSEADAVGRPGLRNASITLSANEKGGEAQLAMAGGALEFPGVFEDAVLPMDQLSALLQWRIETPKSPAAASKVTLQVKNAKFANADAQGEVGATWSTGAGSGVARGGRFPGQIELDGKIGRGIASRVARYLPLGIPQDTRQYVERAVQGGSVSNVTVRVRGDLWDFPFHRVRDPKQGEFHIAAHVDDVNFAYVPSMPASGAEAARESPWPAFSHLSGELVFDRASMEIRNARALVYGVELTRVQGGIRNLFDRSVLALDGSGRGPLADMLRFVNASPVGAWTGKALAHASGSGTADLKLALSIPLGDVDKSTVKGSVTLAGNDLRISPDTPLFGAARARIDFDQKGFGIAGGSARLLGGDASFAGGIQPDGSLRFNGQGTVTADGLRRAPEIGALSRLAASLNGQAAYRMTLGIVHGHSEVGITSNLVGMASELPAPLRKPADTAFPLRYQSTLAAETLASGQTPRDTLRFELGGIIQAQYQRELGGESPKVLRGGIGVFEPAPTPASGVAANISLASLNADAWDTLAGRLWGGAGSAPAAAAEASSFGGYAPTTLAVRAQDLVFGSRHISRVVAGVSQDDGLWRANLDADQLNGYVEYRPSRRGGGAGRVYARLSRLSLPKSDADDVAQLLDQQPAAVPGLDIVVEDFELRGKRLGRVEVEAVNRLSGEGRDAVREWRLNRLAMTTPEAKFNATGNWAAVGATAGGAATARRRAVLNFKLDLADGGGLLERLGTPNAIRGGKGSLAGQVAWLGSPLALDYPSLSGQVNVAIESGQFLKAQPGAARLLGVLSLQSLPRRLALDFRDVFQEGFAFDNFSGDVTIAQGVAHTNNLRMRGVQAAVLMEGSADIAHETQDLRVVVVPEINAGTASLAYAVINPAVGLGTFLAQMFLRKPLTQAGTREFHVTGPWADPKIDRVERKLGEAAPDVEKVNR
ncbi:YhdP family protein [Piscinibacter sp.]|uniref:YhdP family protein n=1 Tax=Piscinibacter sp. TaxID=1903157 RepID=UPI00391FC68B